jgi:hypothetical protein
VRLDENHRMKVACVLAALMLLAPRLVRADQSITVDGAGAGAVFDGVGAISGGGGNTRLLIDYPEPQRSQILDVLFKPGNGAALQMLKVEIGGDTNSTDGSEPTHEHTRGDANYDRGYEWWLMTEAKKRNPAIKIAALAWGAPGWVGSTFWTKDTITYLVDWLKNAQSRHGITVDAIGGWNEKHHDAAWYEDFKAALVASNLTTKVVADDSVGWGMADAMVADPALAKAVDIVGSHYPCVYHSPMTTCSSTPNALATGKPLWASENGSEDYNKGGAAVARAINRGYIDAHMTAYLNWPLIAAIYPNLDYASVGLMVANSPWSGHYELGTTVWASAHTTQVTAPGWRYVDAACGYFAGDRTNGSYVTLRAPSGGDYSVVVETTTATAPQTLDIKLTGGVSTGAVHVWASNFTSNDLTGYFVRQPDLMPAGGGYRFTAQPGWVYSLTTTAVAGHGAASASPPQRPLPLPYADDFNSYPVGKLAKLVSDMQGSFETVACSGGRPGICLRQMTEQEPVRWSSGNLPYAVIGDVGWRDYVVEARVLLEKPGAASLLARVSKIKHAQFTGYVFSVADDGAWSIALSDTGGTRNILSSGKGQPLGVNQWHRLGLAAAADKLTGTVDGQMVGSVTMAAVTSGLAGIGTGAYVAAQFDDLAITAMGGGSNDDAGVSDGPAMVADAAVVDEPDGGVDGAAAAPDAGRMAAVDAAAVAQPGDDEPKPMGARQGGRGGCAVGGTPAPAALVGVVVAVWVSRRLRYPRHIRQTPLVEAEDGRDLIP